MRPCTRCGRCCIHSGFMGSMQASNADVERWKREGRDDILAYVDTLMPGVHDLWMSPETGEEAVRCPFVRKDRGAKTYTCTIYETRPHVCRDYPCHIGHMRTVDCEMLEPDDNEQNFSIRRYALRYDERTKRP